MLMGGRRPPEPGVIGDIDEELHLFLFVIPRRLGKDSFITDQDPQTMSGDGERVEPFTRLEIPHTNHKFADEGEQPSQGHILSVRNEMDLVVPSAQGPIRPEQIRAVHILNRSLFLFEAGRAEEDRGTRSSGEIDNRFLQRTGLLKIKGRGGFGPDDQSVSGRDRFPGKRAVDIDGLRLVERIPFYTLLDISLDESHLQTGRLLRYFIDFCSSNMAIDQDRRDENSRKNRLDP